MKLRPYQQDSIDALWAYYKSKPGAPIIVAPTGSGKSLICAEACRVVREKAPSYHILVVSHRKEIIEQNAKKLMTLIPGEIVGIYSAGLNSKTIRKITFANVQSIYKKAESLPVINFMIIDECHLLPRNSESMYQKLIQGIQRENPNLKIVGLTATPFRLDQGSLIAEGSLFTDICYNISIQELIADGYLSSVISRPSQVSVDLNAISIRGKEFAADEMESAFNPVVVNHARDLANNISNRKHVLCFCSGIDHAENFSKALTEIGIPATFISSKMTNIERDLRVNDFIKGKYRALCNCEILTTGFDFPGIDLLVLARGTMSASLYMQMVGRGMRIAEGKENCLVLDYGGNIKRHGPIDCIEVKAKKKGKAKIGIMPTKDCPECFAVVHFAVKECSCGFVFPEESCIAKLEDKPSEAPILSEIKDYDVRYTEYKEHRKEGKPPSLRCDYYVTPLWSIPEFLCFEHGGYASEVAKRRWKFLGGQEPPPKTISEALYRINSCGELPPIIAIKVKPEGKYSRVVGVAKGEREEHVL